MHHILFYLFCFVLFYFVLFCFILFYFVLFYFIFFLFVFILITFLFYLFNHSARDVMDGRTPMKLYARLEVIQQKTNEVIKLIMKDNNATP